MSVKIEISQISNEQSRMVLYIDRLAPIYWEAHVSNSKGTSASNKLNNGNETYFRNVIYMSLLLKVISKLTGFTTLNDGIPALKAKLGKDFDAVIAASEMSESIVDKMLNKQLNNNQLNALMA